MAETNQKKFGYVVQPPSPPPHPGVCAPTVPSPILPGVSMHDMMHYIDSYMDVRARQMFDKLKDAIKELILKLQHDQIIHNYLLFKDTETGLVYKLLVKDGVLHTVQVSSETEDYQGGTGLG